MAELVRHDPLQLVAREFFECAAGHGDDRIVGGEAGGEGVDAGFPGQHIDPGNRRAGGDGHFLDHVEQAALREARVFGIDPAPPHALSDGAATGVELMPLVERGEADEHQRAEGNRRENPGIPPAGWAEGSGPQTGLLIAPIAGLDPLHAGCDLAENKHRGEIARDDGPEDGEREEQGQAAGALPGAGLGFEEIHRRIFDSRFSILDWEIRTRRLTAKSKIENRESKIRMGFR